LHPILRKYDFDLNRVLDSGEVFEFCNDQSRMLLGTNRIILEENDIESVIGRVENDFYYIDVFERFDQGIFALKERLGWKNLLFDKHNVGIYQQFDRHPDNGIARNITKRNIVDQALYEYLLRRDTV
jgi:hypothetical protein